jgi:hypothetical protein
MPTRTGGDRRRVLVKRQELDQCDRIHGRHSAADIAADVGAGLDPVG